MSPEEILESIEAYPTRLVLVTGGEPMLQQSVHELFALLLQSGCTVLLETGGQASLADVDARVHKIVDFKCPSSGMESHNLYENASYLTRNDEVKFVVSDRNDFDWACNVIRRCDLTARVASIVFSPVFQKILFEDLARWILDCGLDVRMQIQLHKVIWPEAKRGV